MKIVCIGGGPAGLYLGILLKKADPGHEVEIYERNPPDQTFGWGVVFSDETLDNLLEADPESHAEIVRSFVHWDELDIHVKGERFTSRGHGFSGIARKQLLRILQRRAADLGIRVHHGVEISDLSPFASCDLLVGADGIRSRVRAAHAEAFRPSLEEGRCRYIWLGTHKIFERFTFVFEETEHGLFQAHAYRFDPETSTFIVECDESTWRNAGLDRASPEEGARYLERVFARWLDGHPLLLNASTWIRFTTVRNERWHHGNVVLIGDAAHTAHFSIGSGTKLAFEDAILLADSLARHEYDVPRALAAYEEERRPMVARLQKAAQDSLHFFENTRRHIRARPLTFAFNLLTRSKRIGWENLSLRDPELVERVRRAFAEEAGALPVDPTRPVPLPIFTPFRLRDMVLRNRVAVSPMCTYSATDGTVDDFHLVHYGSRAMGGAGLVFTEMTDVSPEGRISPGCAGMYDERHVEAWKRIVDYVHGRTEAKICLQLGHAGRKGSTKRMWEGMDEPLAEGGWEVLAPSPIPYLPHGPVPRAMDRADMDRVRDQFVRATEMAERAGFDMVECHFAHGYLLASFLSPLTNRRTDEYGGSLENRMRYPLEVFRAMRAVWPERKPMSVRISATDWFPGGFDEEDAVELAKALREAGCDIVHVSTGQTVPDARPVYGRMWQTRFAERIRNEAGIPTIAVGNITTADQVNTILAAGRADLCAIGRPHLADPNWTLRAAAELGWQEMDWPNPWAEGRRILERR